MERDIFVQNVKSLCFAKSELPTIACKKAGVGGSFISDVNRGRTPSIEKVQRLADYFGVTTSQLLGEDPLPDNILDRKKRERSKMPVDYLGATTSELLGETLGSSSASIRIPVLGTIPAGIPLEAIEDILDWEEVPAAWGSGGRQYFGLRVRGDSMYPRYLEGDTVILRKETTCESGDDCAVLVNGDAATLKQVMIRGDGSLELRPTNPAYPPRIYSPAEIESFPVQIIGVVVELRRKIK